MRTTQELEVTLHTIYLSSLNLYRFILTEQFRAAYATASDEELITAGAYIDQLDKERLTIWTKRQLRKYRKFELLDMRDLRELAREQGVRNYATITRTELIAGLEHTTDKADLRNNRGNATVAYSDNDGESNCQANQFGVESKA